LFREYQRVLRPGGKVLLLEITRPDNRLGKFLLKAYMRAYVPAVTRWLVGSSEAQKLMQYYWDTIENCVPPEAILGVMKDVGLVEPVRHVVMKVFSEYSATKAK
jgi:demethylmenaquinone methyltransferase/2-methoxy-6-polyprenyl-1,4-benzoquinol methylase